MRAATEETPLSRRSTVGRLLAEISDPGSLPPNSPASGIPDCEADPLVASGVRWPQAVGTIASSVTHTSTVQRRIDQAFPWALLAYRWSSSGHIAP